ncbi:MAG: magnesium transporter [Oscillospiraceae bacterium]|nr:magnesium transporter [Oscillospiraceae bacterium]
MTNETIQSLQDVIMPLLEQKKYASLRDVIHTLNAPDLASILEQVPENALPILFRLLPKELAADTFAFLNSDVQETLITGLSDSELREVVDELYVDDAADLVEEMPANVVSRVLSQASPEKRRMINEILNYPEDSAGSIMTTEYVSLRPNMTVEEAIARIRRDGVDKETINTCFVVDDKRSLLGMLTIRAIILAKEQTLLGDLMNENVVSVTTTEDQETVASMMARYDLTSIPVVDGEGRLVGIVTIDDVVDVLVEEATEDIEKMAAITPSDKPYIQTSVLEIWSKRIPWLLLLMISATFTGLIIARFENALASVVVLTMYIPMLMDTGGNSGSQASVSIIRSLSLNEIEFSDLLRIVWKEFRVAILCGLSLAIVGFAKMMLLDHVGVSVAIVVSLTMLLTVIAAKLIGSTLPMVAKKIGLDPAVCASPFITTMVDALSLLIYFSIATALLHLA